MVVVLVVEFVVVLLAVEVVVVVVAVEVVMVVLVVELDVEVVVVVLVTEVVVVVVEDVVMGVNEVLNGQNDNTTRSARGEDRVPILSQDCRFESIRKMEDKTVNVGSINPPISKTSLFLLSDTIRPFSISPGRLGPRLHCWTDKSKSSVMEVLPPASTIKSPDKLVMKPHDGPVCSSIVSGT